MDDIFDQLIKKRGITEDFLYPKYLLGLADELPDIKKASERIIQAVNNKETVLIYGDYDVDGVTASALMFDCLKMSGVERVEVMYVAPARMQLRGSVINIILTTALSTIGALLYNVTAAFVGGVHLTLADE